MVLGLGKAKGSIGDVGRSKAAPLVQDRKFLSHLTRSLLCSVNPELESAITDSRSLDSSLRAEIIHQFLLVLLGLFLRNKFFSILQFLGNLMLHNFSWKSLFLISSSPSKPAD